MTFDIHPTYNDGLLNYINFYIEQREKCIRQNGNGNNNKKVISF